MKNCRCALVAAVVMAVCTVAFLCRNRPSAEAEGAVLSPVSASLVKTPVVASSAPTPAMVLQPSSNQTATVRGTKPYVLVSETRFNKPLRLAAEALGARTIGVKSVHALLIEADPATRARLVADGRFASVDEFHPADKISSRLAAAIKGGAESVEAGIMTLTPEDHRIVLERVVAMGGEVLTGCLNDDGVFRAKLPVGCVAELASRGDVRWLELFERPHLTNNLAPDPEMMNVRSSWLSEENPGGLSGAGQTITTSDSGIDSGDTATMHPDLRDRVVGIKVVEGCSPKDVIGHGTHTAGSIVGTGAMWTNETEVVVRGMAWGAQLWAWFCGAGGTGISTPKSMSELFRPDQENYPAYIHSASWGSSTYGEYTSQCISLDRYVWANPDFLPVFAAGNDGYDGKTEAIIEGSVGSPAAAKNVLAVGATQSSRTDHDGGWGNGDPQKTADFSSRGPCMDGRIKPDIATPGVGILSTRAHDVDYDEHGYGNYDEFYAYDSGTSMACPLLAGATALVREWLLRDKGFTDENPPSSALMKAIITGGAKDAAVPNNDQGWGRFDLQETLFPSNRAVYLVDKIPFESEESFGWIVETTNGAPFDVQLVWVDYPGEPGDDGSPKLINDLDLTVRRMDGGDAKVLYGNDGGGPDYLNNLESVRIASAEPNRYLVTVNCKDVLFDYEDGGAAALYIRGAFDPAEVKEVPTTIRIRETDLYYRSLDAALAEVKSDETIEILGAARLKNSFMVTNSCTITATNANPWASLVDFRNGAQLMITNGAAVTFTNVALVSNGRTQVRVFDGSCARLSGAFGMDRIQTDNWSCLELATVITNAVEVDCLAASADGDPVAWSDLPVGQMGASANHLLFPSDEERGGAAREGTSFGKVTLVVWQDGALVPDAAAAVRYESETEPTANYRALDVFLKYHKRGTAAIFRNVSLTNRVELEGPLMLYGAAETPVGVAPGSRARLTVGEGSSLVISNLTVHGYVGSYLFHVCGGEMTLAKGAVLSDLSRVMAGEDADEDGNVLSGGVTILERGTFTMLPGAAIRGCSTATDVNFNGYGGGICAWGGKLNLLGGEISNCSADRGGGVYADMSWGDLEVNLGGDLRITGNRYAGGTGAEPDNLYVAGLSLFEEGVVYHPVVVAPLSDSARIGICYDGDRTGNEAGDVFATVADSLAAEEAGAKAFSNDINQKLRPEIDEEGGQKVLRWSTTTEGKVDPDDAYAMTIYGEGTAHSVSNYHERVEQAFSDLTNGATIVMLKGDYYLVDAVPVNYKVIFRADESLPSSAHLVRSSDMSFKIAAGASLTVGNVWLDGNRTRRVQPFFDVCGGSLTLGEGAAISDVSGWDSPSACAVWVSNQGVFRMEEGSEIRSCENAYKGMTDGVEKDADAGLAGGVALSGGTAYLHGGVISNCVAQKGGAIFVGNDSSAYVSGAFVATENGCWKDSPDPTEARASNVTYDGNGRIVLDGVYDGAAGVSRGWNVGLKVNGEETLVTADTNIFGFVEGDVGALVDSARRFHKDAGKGIYGVIATNDVRKLLVWSSAAVDGKFVGEDGTVYGVVEGSEPPPAPEWTVVTNRPTEIAFKSIERVSDTEWALVVTDRVEYCNYRLIWTDDLTKGFTSTGDWEHAVGDVASAQWETNVITTGGAWFWRAEGADGTNMVLKTVEE